MMTDPIADMLTRLRNAQKAEKASLTMPASRNKAAIAAVLKDEGYITDYAVSGEGATRQLEVTLKYFEGEAVMAEIKRISRPGLRVYKGSDELPSVNGGLGVAIISTNKGLMTDRAARAAGVGGEILCAIS
jgi:small subunit ribosomal protein S8